MGLKIMYGTAWKKENTTALVVSAVLHGFTAIDTACQPKHYREDLVGEALKILREEHNIKREEIFLQTKFTSVGGQDTAKPLPYDPSTSVAQQVETSFKTSLKNLRTTYLDSYILHSPLRTLKQTLEAWRVLMALQDQGKVRMIGVSNTYSVSILEALGSERKVQVVQNRWYEKNQWDREVCKYCKDHDIQYQSFWTLSGSPSLLQHPDLTRIAEASECTAEQAVFRLAQLNGIIPLSGTTNELHMEQDVAAEHIRFNDGISSCVRSVQSLVWG